jgi:beta-hydroxylase
MTGSSRLGDPKIFDTADFPWVAELEAAAPDIRQELDELIADLSHLPAIEEISPDHARIARERRWRSFFLYAYGYRSDTACAACPRTAASVDAIPDLETAFFSFLVPGAHLPPHRGVTKALITCHLPLIVPDDRQRCWIRVEDCIHQWEPGRAFVFDDTRRHEVRNDTDQIRVVLLIHVRRPLAYPGRLAGDAFMAAVKRSPFVRDGVRNQQTWEKSYLALKEARRRSAAVVDRGVVEPVEIGDGEACSNAGEGVVVDDSTGKAGVEQIANRRNETGPAGT